jgi:hypothetical protein
MSSSSFVVVEIHQVSITVVHSQATQFSVLKQASIYARDWK